jgi:sorting nexin-8
VRGRIVPLIEQWQRICILSERIIKRREAAAVRSPALRRAFLPTHFTLPDLSPSSTTVHLPGSSPSMTGSLTQSFWGFDTTGLTESQGDISRLTNTLRSVVEVSENCWRGDDCELSNGVRSGLGQLAAHTQRHSEISELRVRHGLLSLTIVDCLAVKGPSGHHIRISKGEIPSNCAHSLS